MKIQNKYYGVVLVSILLVGLFSCNSEKATVTSISNSNSNPKTMTKPRSMTPNNDGTTSCQVVYHDSRRKNGKLVGQDLYLRCSIQDYYIKFCESNVKREDVEKYVDQGITVKMEVRSGEWDNCHESEYPVQSRVGEYVIIKEIVE